MLRSINSESYGIGTQVHYIPLFLQPYYKVNKNYFPNAMKYYLSTLSIPLYPNLKNTDTSYIISKIKKIMEQRFYALGVNYC